jgi:hypothetical protein
MSLQSLQRLNMLLDKMLNQTIAERELIEYQQLCQTLIKGLASITED